MAQVDTTSAISTSAAAKADSSKSEVREELSDFEELNFDEDSGPQIPPDSLQTHSVKKATLMSLCLPGLGQIYNGKWWKTPFVYAAIGVPTFLAVENHEQYRHYLDAFYNRLDDDANNDYELQYTEANLIDLQDYYRRRRDLMILIAAVGYGLNILDAYVDAHLYYYDISDNISLQWEPAIWRNPAGFNNVGVSLKLQFK